MRNLLMLIALIAMPFMLLSQNAETQIIGKWIFSDFANKEKVPAEQLEMLKEMFKEAAFQFEANKTYAFSGLSSKPEIGKWQIEEKTLLKLTSEKGIVTKIKIVKADAQLLTLDMNGPIIIFSKTKVSEAVVMDDKPKMPVVAATLDAFAKKWYIVKVEKPGHSAERIERAAAMMKGSYMDFQKTGSVNVKILNFDDTSKWAFENDNKTIRIKNGDDEKIWNIVKIDSENLEMTQGNSADKWVFSTKP
jgi:flagellar assembly factor FliW